MQNSKRPPSSRSTHSIYSHTSGRSSGLKSSRSIKSLRIPWYQRPIVHDAFIVDIQRGALLIGIYCIVMSLFSIATAIFDIYCLYEAAPGSTHTGYYIISFEFVYAGNAHVRNSLIVFALFTLLGAIVVLVTSCILIQALRKEHEKNFVPWLFAMAVFTCWRFFVFIFASIVNDMIFGYHITMCLIWIVFVVTNTYGWVVVYSLYLELSDLTKLEDLAHLRMGTMASLNASMSHSVYGSQPTTPKSTTSTMPAPF